jgi:hypothetical protein
VVGVSNGVAPFDEGGTGVLGVSPLEELKVTDEPRVEPDWEDKPKR